jgi:hypothetical protein
MKKFEITFDCTVETKSGDQKTKHTEAIYESDINTAISRLKLIIIKSYEQCKVMYFPDLIEISLDFFNVHFANIKYSNFRGKEV